MRHSFETEINSLKRYASVEAQTKGRKGTNKVSARKAEELQSPTDYKTVNPVLKDAASINATFMGSRASEKNQEVEHAFSG